MPTTPEGPIAEPLDVFRSMLNAQPAWQNWAGAEYADRVHLSENRTQVEQPGGGPLLWINETLVMPFSILWMPQLSMFPQRCRYEYTVLMMFQDVAKDRQDHDESAITFATNVGKVIQEVSDHIREGTGTLVPNVPEITMPGEPSRVSIADSSVRHDYWTTTFMFEVR
jgi:hypothetical protein